MFDYQFEWKNSGAGKVFVTGSFDNWQQINELEKQPDGTFMKVIQLPTNEKKIIYKYVVDGNWVIDNSKPIEDDGKGNQNNYIDIPVENEAIVAAGTEDNTDKLKSEQEEQEKLKKEEEERIKKQQEEEERIRKQKEEEERIKKQKEEEERLKREEEEKIKKQKEEEEKIKKQKEEQEKLKKQLEDVKNALREDDELRERTNAKSKSKQTKGNKALKEELQFNENATKYAFYGLAVLGIAVALIIARKHKK